MGLSPSFSEINGSLGRKLQNPIHLYLTPPLIDFSGFCNSSGTEKARAIPLPDGGKVGRYVQSFRDNTTM